MDNRNYQKHNFVVGRTSNGVVFKRFYTISRDKQGLPVRNFTYSRRMNLPEKILYKYSNYYSLSKRQRRQVQEKVKFAIATFLAGATLIAGLAFAFNENNPGTSDSFDTSNDAYYESGEMPSQNTSFEKGETTNITENQEQTQNQEQGYVVPDKAPTPVTYFDNGVEFVSLDSIIEISKYNHAQLIKEIEAYNKTVSADKRIEFDTDLFDAEFFAAIAIQENSLKIKNPSNPKHKGCYQIGSAAFEEAKLMAEKLGTTLPDSLEDLENPLYGNKASMYIYVQNYNRYLKNAIKEQGYNKEQIKAATTTAYLFGGPSTAGKIRKGEFVDSVYHTKIDEYAKIVREFSDKLYNDGLISKDKTEERTSARKAAFVKLYQVTNESAKKILAEKQANSDQSEQGQ